MEATKVKPKTRSSSRKSKKVKTNALVLIPTSRYPCRWDDILDAENEEVLISVCCMEAAGEDENPKEGIFKADDGVWDIFVDDEHITVKKLKELLDAWSALSGKKYKVVWDENYLDYTKA